MRNQKKNNNRNRQPSKMKDNIKKRKITSPSIRQSRRVIKTVDYSEDIDEIENEEDAYTSTLQYAGKPCW